MTTNVLKKLGFIHIAIAASVAIPLLIGTSANAQAPAAGGEATTERVVVTGSLIPTAEEVTANPVDILSQQDIRRSGEATDVLQVLSKRDPDFVGVGNLGQTNANIAAGNGSSAITIRGLPTLVLFENRRFADDATVALGSGAFSDVSLFPTALISRLEVLKDGASAQYGSDAVGGVVNIFLNDDFTGLEIGFRYGNTLESSTPQRRSYVIAGAGNDTTHVVAAIQYYEQDPLFMRERFYSRLPLGGVTTTFGGTGRDNRGGGTKFYLIDNLDPAHWPLGSSINSPLDFVAPQSVAPPPFNSGAANPGQYELINVLAGTTVYRHSSQAEVTSYDLSFKPTSTLDISNNTAYASFDHKICGDQLEAFGNFIFAHNHSESNLNAQPLNNGTGVVILGTMRVDPLNPSGPLIPENRGDPAPYSPFQLSIDNQTLSGNFRLFANNRYQSNPRRFTNDNNFYRFLGGLKSQINKDWSVEGAMYYSHYSITFVNENLVNALALNALIAGQFDANGVLIPGTALDFFAVDPLNNGARSVDPALFATIFGDNIRDIENYQRVFDGHITGFPLAIPGGDIGVAAGVEYRIEGFKFQDSPEIFIGSVPVPASNHGRNIFSAYVELAFPIVSSEMHIPGIYNFELRVSGRLDKYEGIAGDSKVPKLMGRWQPIKDITVRGTFGNSFIAPDLFQLFGPTGSGFSPSITLNGEVQDQAQVAVPTNSGLVPSTAQSWTGGVVYSPHYLPGLTLSVDYFWTLQQQIVIARPASLILTDVDNNGPASQFASLVSFNNFPGQPGAQMVTDTHQLQGNLASVFYIAQLVNIGADRVEGFDLNLNYNIDLINWGLDFGQLELGVRSVVFTGHDRKYTPSDHYFNVSGYVGDEGFGFFPDYKITFLVEHRWKGATLTLSSNYIPEMLNIVGEDPQQVELNHRVGDLPVVEDYITVDGRLSYTFHPAAAEAPAAPEPKDGKTSLGKNVPGVAATSCWSVSHWLDGLTLAVGCNNIWDEDPRIVVGGNSSTNLAVYDPFGRFVYFEVNKKF